MRLRLFKKLRKKLDYLDDDQIERIYQAYLLAVEAHRGQRRSTGEPYVTHPVAVAGILADMRLDYQTLMAALLHDVIEDTAVTKKDLIADFGQTVADLVDGVSKLTQIEFFSKAHAQAENFRKMVLAMAQDIRVMLIKLADRLHNMRTLGALRPDKKRRIARETMDIYAPVAKRLGMRDISVELEELCFVSLYPRRYAIIKDAVQKARGHRKKVLQLIDTTLRDGFTKSNLPTCVVMGREKHLYSIYRKMHKKRIPFNEIMDVYAFRIIVDEVDTCYRALGVVHSLFKPVPERFKDYIAIPKFNGYQSLHTTLFGPYGLPIEIQIRTTVMDRMATSGIAAHWLYKNDESAIDETQLRAQQWVKNLLELQQRSGNSIEFIESVKVDLFPDEVYVFTPKGDIKELPAGSTVIDFAYAVHTDVGNHCVACKIDRKLAPLSSVLINGQTVEVVTSSRGRPSPVWLDFVVTSKARSGVRHFLKTQRVEEAEQLGLQMLMRALKSKGFIYKHIDEDIFQSLIQSFQLTEKSALFIEIGMGNRPALLVAQQLINLNKQRSQDEQDERAELVISEQAEAIAIKGAEGMLIDFAKCCMPIPGDPIVGMINAGSGILVHCEKCRRISKLLRHPEQYIVLRWADNTEGEFLVRVILEVLNRRGILAVLALAVSDADGNVEDIRVGDHDGQYYQVEFDLMVSGRQHLARIIKSLRQIPEVTKLQRFQ